MAVLYDVFALSVAWMVIVNLLAYCLNENSYPAKRFGFHGFLTVSNKAKGVSKDKRPQEFFVWDLLDPKTLISGHCVGPIPILVYRVFVLVVFISTISYQGLGGIGLELRWLTYFTNWTFTLMGLYVVLGIILSSKAVSGKFGTEWGRLEKAFILVFVTACSCGIFLVIFYWVILSGGGHVEGLNLIYHGGNVVLMLGELLLSRIPVCSYHLQIAFHYRAIYSVFFYAYYMATGVWVYPPLSLDSNMDLIYAPFASILLVLSFYFMHLVAFLREQLFSKCGGKHEETEESSLETLL